LNLGERDSRRARQIESENDARASGHRRFGTLQKKPEIKP
jgi:hypothetical protein